MSNKNKSKEKYIPISNIAYNLGLVECDVRDWLLTEKADIKLDYRNREAVSSRYLELLSIKSEYIKAKCNFLKSQNILQKEEGDAKKLLFRSKRIKLLKNYSSYILILENLHKKCLDRVNSYHHESYITAAYLLISKVISCLKMGCLNLEHGYWYGGSIMREIDEALDLSHYFVISKDTEDGKINLQKWFRCNRSPKHSVCRKVIAKHFSDISYEFDEKNHYNLMNELYQSKSKWTHPTYLVIREVTQFDINSSLNISKIEYGKITFESKLYGLTDFFLSSIRSSFQVFGLCFSLELPLTESERTCIEKYDMKFQKL